jgi:hypothetical protein
MFPAIENSAGQAFRLIPDFAWIGSRTGAARAIALRHAAQN